MGRRLNFADRDFFEQRIKALVADSSKIVWHHPHIQMRLSERRLSLRHILETLRKGEIMDGPTRDEWGDWRAKFHRVVAGRRVQVVVAYKGDHVVVVTAI